MPEIFDNCLSDDPQSRSQEYRYRLVEASDDQLRAENRGWTSLITLDKAGIFVGVVSLGTCLLNAVLDRRLNKRNGLGIAVGVAAMVGGAGYLAADQANKAIVEDTMASCGVDDPISPPRRAGTFKEMEFV